MPAAARLLDPLDLALPALPHALQGLRIAHLTDLHVRADTRLFDRLITRLAAARLDLVFLTGDLQHRSADPAHALGVLQHLTDQVRPAIGTFGCWGNHDSAEFRERSLELPIRWLSDDADLLPGHAIELIGYCGGTDTGPDDAAVLADRLTAARGAAAPRDASSDHESRPLRLMLTHFPNWLPTAADLGVDLMFCGHTHGGQVRLPFGYPIHVGNGYPHRMSAGLLRSRDTLCVISRGLGESNVRLRVLCPRQVIMCTLRRGPMPGRPCDGIELIQRW